MKVKICGITSVSEASAAITAGADYIGFLVGITHLAEDKLTNGAAREIIGSVDFGRAIPVAVTHLRDARSVIRTMHDLCVRTVQLHDDIAEEEIYKIRDAIPDSFIIKTVHVRDASSIDKALVCEKFADAILLDSRTAERLGGTGLTHDWSISRQIVEAVHKPVFLAGGLNPDNLREAIDKVRPCGVDVNSGVEKKDGSKDAEKMRDFVNIAKTLS